MRNLVEAAVTYTLAAFLAFIGLQKFIGDVPIFSIIEANIAGRTGLAAPFVEPYGRYLTGILEFAAAGLLLVRRYFGGLLALLISAGAVLAHLTFLGVSTPVSGAPDAPESPALFIMALATLGSAAFVTLSSKAYSTKPHDPSTTRP